MSNPKNKPEPAAAPLVLEESKVGGRYAYDGLERVIHEKARLGIVTSLATHPDGLLFNDLKELCSLTDGNLSRHLQILHEAGLVEVWKGYLGNRPQTLIRLTADGRKRFVEYVSVLESVVTDALKAPRTSSAAKPKIAEGWSPV
jgi:DNA-binding MarR family transcriptional regulator